MLEGVYIRIELGEPYDEGSIIPLEAEKELLIGRANQKNNPDVALISPYISRQHAIIYTEDSHVYVKDLHSKHGTELNDETLQPEEPYLIESGDRIRLAKGAVELTFIDPSVSDMDMTLEFSMPAPSLSAESSAEAKGLYIIPERRQIVIDQEPLFLSGKHTDLLILLFNRKNQAVSYDEMKLYVWPERKPAVGSHIPDVGNEEINALIYRLRKKLGRYGDFIISLPRYGYMLELEE